MILAGKKKPRATKKAAKKAVKKPAGKKRAAKEKETGPVWKDKEE